MFIYIRYSKLNSVKLNITLSEKIGELSNLKQL